MLRYLQGAVRLCPSGCSPCCIRNIATSGRRCSPLALAGVAALLPLLLLLALYGASSKYVSQRAAKYLACSWQLHRQPVCELSTIDPGELMMQQLYLNSSYKQPDLFAVTCRLMDMDNIVGLKAQMACTIGSAGIYSKPYAWNVLQLPINQTLYLQINDQLLNLSDSQAPAPVVQDVFLGFSNGKSGVAAYPNDALAFEIHFSAWITDPNALNSHQPPFDSIATGVAPAPLNFTFIYGYHNLYDVQVDGPPLLIGQVGGTPTVLIVSGQVRMNELSRSLFYLLQVVMWVVTFLTLVSATLWVFNPGPGNEQHGSADLLSFSGALLFALPTMRGLWPAAPVGGTQVDVLCIYAQLVCVGVAIMAQLVRRALYNAGPHAAHPSPAGNSVSTVPVGTVPTVPVRTVV